MNENTKLILDNARDYFFKPHVSSHGIESFASLRFWLVFLCYAGCFLCIVRDTYFWEYYHFTLHGVVPLLIAFLIAATVNWELLCTGRPGGANLLLQCVMIPPFSLLLARMLGNGSTPSLPRIFDSFEPIKAAMEKMSNALKEYFPSWLNEIVSHPMLGLLLFFTLLALCMKSSHLRLSFIVFILVTSLATTFSDGVSLCFIIAFFLFICGIVLQWNPYAKINYFINIKERIGNSTEDERVFSVILRTMDKLFRQNEMNSREFSHVVADSYSRHGEYSQEELKLICNEISRIMIEKYKLVSVVVNANGSVIHPLAELYESNKVLSNITIFPKIAAVATVSILWSIMPIDGIPDYVPVLGILDDLFICGISLNVIRDCVKRLGEG